MHEHCQGNLLSVDRIDIIVSKASGKEAAGDTEIKQTCLLADKQSLGPTDYERYHSRGSVKQYRQTGQQGICIFVQQISTIC